MFRRCLSIVRNSTSGDLWEFVTYLVFDVSPKQNSALTYEERLEVIKLHVKPVDKAPRDNSGHQMVTGKGTPYAAPVGTVRCTSRAHLTAEMQKVEAKGGEGLMLREAKSLYGNGNRKRSKALLKVKSTHDEEAKVVGHKPSKSDPEKCGAVILKSPDGREFSCGSGMTEKDRRKPPRLGSVVTYRYTELMDNGYPRFPVFVAQRLDLDWNTICQTYPGAGAATVSASVDNASGISNPRQLKRDHFILYAPQKLVRTLLHRL